MTICYNTLSLARYPGPSCPGPNYHKMCVVKLKMAQLHIFDLFAHSLPAAAPKPQFHTPLLSRTGAVLPSHSFLFWWEMKNRSEKKLRAIGGGEYIQSLTSDIPKTCTRALRCRLKSADKKFAKYKPGDQLGCILIDDELQ